MEVDAVDKLRTVIDECVGADVVTLGYIKVCVHCRILHHVRFVDSIPCIARTGLGCGRQLWDRLLHTASRLTIRAQPPQGAPPLLSLFPKALAKPLPRLRTVQPAALHCFCNRPCTAFVSCKLM